MVYPTHLLEGVGWIKEINCTLFRDFHTVSKKNRKIINNARPTSNRHCPLFDYFHCRKIKYFHCSIITDKCTFCLCCFAQLTVVVLNCVGRINEFSDFRRVFDMVLISFQLSRQLFTPSMYFEDHLLSNSSRADNALCSVAAL